MRRAARASPPTERARVMRSLRRYSNSKHDYYEVMPGFWEKVDRAGALRRPRASAEPSVCEPWARGCRLLVVAPEVPLQ